MSHPTPLDHSRSHLIYLSLCEHVESLRPSTCDGHYLFAFARDLKRGSPRKTVANGCMEMQYRRGRRGDGPRDTSMAGNAGRPWTVTEKPTVPFNPTVGQSNGDGPAAPPAYHPIFVNSAGMVRRRM